VPWAHVYKFQFVLMKISETTAIQTLHFSLAHPVLCIEFAILRFPCSIVYLITFINVNKYNTSGEALKIINLSNKPWGNPYCSLVTREQVSYSVPERETIPTYTLPHNRLVSLIFWIMRCANEHTVLWLHSYAWRLSIAPSAHYTAVMETSVEHMH
jgi:hypothetical protein